jgi:hypothetical protein
MRTLLGHIYLVVIASKFEYVFHFELTAKLHNFHKLAKIDDYGVTYLRAVNRCKYESL